MAPPFRKKRLDLSKIDLRQDPRRETKNDPERLAYSISENAARVLIRASSGPTPQNGSIDGYAARHLVEKGLLRRVAEGRHASYALTFRGEAVLESLRKRKSFSHLFPPAGKVWDPEGRGFIDD